MAKNLKAPKTPADSADAGDPVPSTRTYIVVSPLWVGGKKHLTGARVALTEAQASGLAGIVEPVPDEDAPAFASLRRDGDADDKK